MKYRTAANFRVALETRLKQRAARGPKDFVQLRRIVAFERLLARLFAGDEPPWLLKGGFVMEMRVPKHARVTKDVDLSVPLPLRLQLRSNDPAEQMMAVRTMLQEAASVDLHDWFSFTIGEPMRDLDNAPYGGARLPVAVRLDKPFIAFHLDVGLGDVNVGAQEWLVSENLLDFAEVPAPRFAAISREQQFAEKIHAYTLPRERENSRVKDLVDLLLLLDLGLPDENGLRAAIRETFARRKTHALPVALDPPPATWEATFADFATECSLAEGTVTAACARVNAYWQTLALSGE